MKTLQLIFFLHTFCWQVLRAAPKDERTDVCAGSTEDKVVQNARNLMQTKRTLGATRKVPSLPTSASPLPERPAAAESPPLVSHASAPAAPTAAADAAAAPKDNALQKLNSRLIHQGPSHAYPHKHVAKVHGKKIEQADADAIIPANFRLDSAVSTGAYGMVLTLMSSFVMLALAFLEQKRPSKGKDHLCLESEQPPQAFQGYQRRAKISPADEGGLSAWDATVATFSGIAGMGVLAMPYAFSLAGLIAAPFIVLVVCCSAYTAHLMVWAFSAAEQCSLISLGLRYIGDTSQQSPKLLDSRRPSEQGSPVLRSWGCLVEVAFGRRARCAMNIFLVVETWGYLLSYIVGASMNLSEMLGDTHEHNPVGIMISVIFAYVISAYPLRRLTRVNIVSGVMTMLCFGLFIVSGLMLPERAPATELQVFNLPGLISASGILMFSPAAHAFYPDIMARMDEPQLYTACLRRSYGAACILYLAVGVTGYTLFGQAAQDSLIQNIGLDRGLQPLQGMSWMGTIAASGMAFRFLVLQAYVLPTLTASVESLTGITSNYSRSIVLALSAGMAAFFAKKAALLLNLLGSAVCINIAFTVPVLCYWRLSRRARTLPFYEQALLFGLLSMGISFSVLGVVSCVSS